MWLILQVCRLHPIFVPLLLDGGIPSNRAVFASPKTSCLQAVCLFLQAITLSSREIVYDNEIQLLAIDEAVISIEGEQ